MKNLIVLCVIVFCQLPLLSQPKPVIKNLVFEGAGLRGIAYSGAISEMESRNMLDSIEKVGGTSSGAIVALAVSLGYSGKEIQDIIARTNFKKFNDGRYFFIGGINRMNKYFGWYRGRRFETWLEKIICKKTGNADITFAELYEKKYKALYITGTCLNKQQLVIFSHETYPNMKIKDAVRISVSIPLYFEAVFIDKEGKIIYHPKQRQGLDIMVDGGITGNFPIRMFDTLSRTNFSTLGFRIDSEEQIKNDREGKSIAALPTDNLKQYMYAFYNIMIENLNRQPLTKDDWKRTISVSDGAVRPKIRKLSATEINILIESGKQAIKTYLN
jgi:NTE family protein